ALIPSRARQASWPWQRFPIAAPRLQRRQHVLRRLEGSGVPAPPGTALYVNDVDSAEAREVPVLGPNLAPVGQRRSRDPGVVDARFAPGLQLCRGQPRIERGDALIRRQSSRLLVDAGEGVEGGRAGGSSGSRNLSPLGPQAPARPGSPPTRGLGRAAVVTVAFPARPPRRWTCPGSQGGSRLLDDLVADGFKIRE